ncbi:MAG: hypothetical protein M3442_19525, partial [Chloroflexota bacterium]|nr:hypothetical protein [Chloroflexota bacterium]
SNPTSGYGHPATGHRGTGRGDQHRVAGHGHPATGHTSARRISDSDSADDQQPHPGGGPQRES